MVLVTRLVFGTVAYAAAWLLASGTGARAPGALELWSRWDALHFFAIARDGYAGAGPFDTAFFPGFPLAIRWVSALGPSDAAAGLLVSALACLVAFAFLYRLGEDEAGPGGGRRAVAYLAFFPTAVFLVAPYSEALFLAGAVPAFYFARRGRWVAAGLGAALATATRFAGAFLVAGLVVEWICTPRERSGRRLPAALAGFAIGLAPLIAYTAHLGVSTGDPLRFFTDQRQGWGRTFTDPISAFANTWNTWSGADYPTNWIFAWRVEILAAIAGVGFVAWGLARREWGYTAYMGTTMAALLTSTWYFSIPRMLLSLFPAMLFLADATGRDSRRHEGALIVLAPLATLGVIVFTQGAWFY
jgi:hypothetical protein